MKNIIGALFNDSVFEKVEIISRGEIVETKNDNSYFNFSENNTYMF